MRVRHSEIHACMQGMRRLTHSEDKGPSVVIEVWGHSRRSIDRMGWGGCLPREAAILKNL